MQYTAAKTDAKRCQVPGCSYFKNIYSFTGEMFLEYQKGACKISAINYATFASQVESVVVRLSAFQGYSLIIKDLDFTTYTCGHDTNHEPG